MRTHSATAWLVNTGWTAGPYGVGHRMKLKHTRSIIDAIHNGELEHAKYSSTPIFNLHVSAVVPHARRLPLISFCTFWTLQVLRLMFTNSMARKQLFPPPPYNHMVCRLI